MYAIARRLDVLAPVLVDCDHSGGGNKTREVPVGVFPFADVQVGPDCEFGRCISAVAVEYGPASETVERKERQIMIGTKYTSELLAAFAKMPRLCRMDVKVEPDGREIAFYPRRYADGGVCATTVFDAEDRELATYEEIVDLDDVRFGFAVDKCIAKATVHKHAVADALQAVFNVHGADPDAVKVESVVLPADSVVEGLHTKSNVFISFYENATSDDPWLRICEPA